MFSTGVVVGEMIDAAYVFYCCCGGRNDWLEWRMPKSGTFWLCLSANGSNQENKGNGKVRNKAYYAYFGAFGKKETEKVLMVWTDQSHN